MALSITTDFTGCKRLLLQLERCVGPEGRAALLELAGQRMVKTEIPMVFRNGGPGWAPIHRDGRPLLDTGLLAASMTFRVEGGSKLTVGTPLKYARIQNEGGTVVPRNGKFLTIPLSPPLTVSQRRVSKARDFADTFVYWFRRKGGEVAGLIMWKRGKRSKPVPIFLLVKKVTIKARPFLRWTDTALQNIARKWTEAIGRGEVA